MNKEKIQKITFSIARIAITIFFITMILVSPFYFTDGYTNIGTDKSIFFRYVGSALLLFFVFFTAWKIVWCDRLCLTDKFILEYTLVLFVSYLLSSNKEEAFLGTGGWYIGLLTQLIYVCIYFGISRFLKWNNIFAYLMILASGIVFLLGLLNRFSCYPLTMNGANSGFISTLGNINWYCGFWSVFFPLGAGLFLTVREESKWKKVVLGVYVMIAAATGATQGSDSSMLVFGSVLFVLFMIWSHTQESRLRFYELVMLICGSFIITGIVRNIFPEAMNYQSISANLLTKGSLAYLGFTIFALLFVFIKWVPGEKTDWLPILKIIQKLVLGVFVVCLAIYVILLVINTRHPGSIGKLSDQALFIFNDTWGSSRGITWKAGMTVFFEQPFLHKLIGLGPDSFAYGVYLPDSSATEMVIERFGSARLTNAHNEWITVLVNTGIFGLIANLGFFLSAAFSYLKRKEAQPVVFACGLAIVSYITHNIFSFQQALNGPYIYLVAGIGTCILRVQDKNKKSS